MSALRVAERMTRSGEEPAPETPPQERWSYPVDPDGVFDPGCRPQLWPLKLNWRWSRSLPAEGVAITGWRHSRRRERWEAAGSPWSRAEWERDPRAWQDALAALED